MSLQFGCAHIVRKSLYLCGEARRGKNKNSAPCRNYFCTALLRCIVGYSLGPEHQAANGILFLNAVEVRTVASVNLDKVALVDEERHTDFNTCLQSSRLGSVGSCIALDARLRVSYAQVGLNRHFGKEDSTVAGIGNDLNNIAFLHELHTSNLILVDRNLLEGLLVHEDATCWVFIEILIWATLYAYILKLESNLECALKHSSVGNILQLGNHYGVAFTWFPVLEVDASPDFAIHADASSNFDFL